MSEDYALYCAEVFLANDFVVNYFKNSCSTPVVMYRTMLEDNDYGVMITASHNPHIYNGIKIFTKGGKDGSIEDTQEIEKEFHSLQKIFAVDFYDYKGSNFHVVDHVEEFIEYLIKNQEIPQFSDLKIVFDNKFGSTTEALRILCKKLGIKNHKILQGKRDPLFHFELPLPAKDNVSKLQKELIKGKYDIGFALDSDGDRIGVVDEKGNYFDNNVILALIYYYFVKYKNKKGGVVKNLATSVLVDALAKKFGYECYEVPVGFKFISSKLIETNSVVGGESSGGLAIQNHIWGKDSLLSIALCIKIIKELKKPFSQIVKEMLDFAYNFSKVIIDEQIIYPVNREAQIKDKLFKDKKMPKVNHKLVKTYLDDGLKLYYENKNWSLIRFSGTEPLIRLYVEFDTMEECQEELALLRNFLGL